MSVLRPTGLAPAMLALLGLAVAAVPSQAQTSTLTVLGTNDPWLAGQPNGTNASVDDFAPGESPAQVLGLNLADGGFLTFTASGAVSHGPGIPAFGPDGDPSTIASHLGGAQNGISDVTVPIDSLIGVFIGPGVPSGTAPAGLNFSSAGSQGYLTLAPALDQVFFIGDGLTGTQSKQISIPTGAAGLYLGPMDGYEWENNTGSFKVSVAQNVPESCSLALLGLGLFPLALVARRRVGMGN